MKETRSYTIGIQNSAKTVEEVITLMEVDQENHVQMTHSSTKKRASMTQSSLPQPTLSKKRVVLGELTNSPDLGSTEDPKCRSKSERAPYREKKPVPELKEENKHETIKELDQNISDLKKFTFFSSIYQHLHSLEIEEKRRPLPNYMEKVQNDLTANMREILIDWLMEVAEEYKLVSDTVYLTVSYIDRFLSSHSISRDKLQLLGVSCMLIASKYEEITPPRVDDFCYMTDNCYTKEEVVEMEKNVLKLLNFEIGTPTTRNFLRTLRRVAQENVKHEDLQVEFLSCYIAELCLLDYEFVQFLPSVVASAALFFSRFMIKQHRHPWGKALECYSGYKPSELEESVLAIHGLYLRRNLSSGLTQKYLQHKFKAVATLPAPSEVPQRYFETALE